LVLAGQPAFLETLQWPELSAFRQRLAVRVTLEPLGLEEAADYLAHRIRAAGGRPEAVFADEALQLLATATQGVPRLLNQAAHQALALAYGSGASIVDVEAALESLAMLGLDADTLAEPERRFPAVVGPDEGIPAENSCPDEMPTLGLTDPSRRPA
jgi:hypothetical protein